MNQSIKGFRQSRTSFRRSADVSEDVGNRHGFLDMKIPSDDLGNLIEHDPIATFIHDSLGNTLEGEPAHLKSGFMNTSVAKERKPRFGQKEIRTTPVVMEEKSGDDYIAKLKSEFKKLLANKNGMPFSFLMRPKSQMIDDSAEKEYLESIEDFLLDIISGSSIEASFELVCYHTNEHRFAVFFLSSEEKDPAKNKNLISALRKVVALYEAQLSPIDINVMLVLSNAKSLIEEHLQKIGASKDSP